MICWYVYYSCIVLLWYPGWGEIWWVWCNNHCGMYTYTLYTIMNTNTVIDIILWNLITCICCDLGSNLFASCNDHNPLWCNKAEIGVYQHSWLGFVTILMIKQPQGTWKTRGFSWSHVGIWLSRHKSDGWVWSWVKWRVASWCCLIDNFQPRYLELIARSNTGEELQCHLQPAVC